MPRHSISARYGNVNNHYIISLWVCKWSLFYSLYVSVLPYFGQWIYISCIIRGKKKILHKNRYWIKGHFSLGSDRPTMLLTPGTDLGGKSVVLLLTVPWQQAYQPQVAGVLRSLTPSGAVSCAGPRSISHLRLLGISGPIISILDSGILSHCCSKRINLSLSLSFPLFMVLTEILLSEGCFSSDVPCARRLGNDSGIFFLVNGYFETLMLSLSCTMPSSFDVYNIWLYHPLRVLITGMCGLPDHSQIFIENSDTWVTATQDLLSRTTPSTFLRNSSLKPLWPANSESHDFLYSSELPPPPGFCHHGEQLQFQKLQL